MPNTSAQKNQNSQIQRHWQDWLVPSLDNCNSTFEISNIDFRNEDILDV